MCNVRRGFMMMSVLVLALAWVAQAQEFPGGGPPMMGPRPQPTEVMREYAEVLRARAREAHELGERLHHEADGLERLARLGPDRGPQEMERRHRELVEIKEAILRAERDGHGEEAAELRRQAERLRDEARPPKPDPGPGGPEQIGRLREEARRAKEHGRLEEARRLWEHAEGMEIKWQWEQEIRRMSGHVEAMKDKAIALGERSQQAKREGRHEEARELGEKAEQIKRDLVEAVQKIERFKADSQRKDLHVLAERARKQGDHPRAEALFEKARRLEEGRPSPPKGPPPHDDDLIRTIEELKREVKQLRREMDDLRRHAGEPRPM